jgi:LPXTG-motif cell wall-anchored protein
MATATSPGRAGRLPVPPSPDHDWPAQAADTIERAVGAVRDKTTAPALTVARAIAYGTFAVLVGTACLAVLIIGAVRALDVALPDSVFGEDHVWAAYLILGVVFVVAGGVLWRRRKSSGEDRPAP